MIEKIFLCNNKGVHQSTAEEAGINDLNLDDEIYENSLRWQRKIKENKSHLN